MNPTQHDRESKQVSKDEGNQARKKTYRPPTLTLWGSVAELTRGNATGVSDGALTGSGGT